MKKLSVLLLLVVISILSACGNEGYTNIDAEKANEMITEQNIQVIDVRTIPEYEAGHIPGAKVIPLQELTIRLTELDKDDPYIIVCQSGNRSSQASEILVNNGFKKIYNMDGGMNVWPFNKVTGSEQ